MKKARPYDDEADIVSILTLKELSHFCGTDQTWVVELINHGVVKPAGPPRPEFRFSPPGVRRAKKARRLERDLGLNMAGIALVLDLLEERDRLRRQLARTRGR